MPKNNINNMISELNEIFGAEKPSKQQQQLLQELENHVHNVNESEPVDPSPMEIIETMLENLGEEHPKASLLLKQLLDTLKNIGV